MSANLKFGLFLIALLCAMGVAGTDDYNYRCDQARKANKNETCKMVASKP